MFDETTLSIAHFAISITLLHLVCIIGRCILCMKIKQNNLLILHLMALKYGTRVSRMPLIFNISAKVCVLYANKYAKLLTSQQE